MSNPSEGRFTSEKARPNQPKPHRLVAQVASWGEVGLTVECPYVFGEPRPCNLYEEDKSCTDDDCPYPWLEFGHAHPADDCVVQYYISEMSWGEAIRWTSDEPVTVPTDVQVYCDEVGVEMEPWRTSHGGRKPEGGTDGV